MKRMQLKLMSAMAGVGAAVAVAGLSGCVERRITIGSQPTGALVYLNDVEVGRTPVTVPFTWYGDYDVRLRLEKAVGPGETGPGKPSEGAAGGAAGAAGQTIEKYYLHTHQRASAPWFQLLGVDLFAELLPVPFKDDKVWAFEVPKVVEPSDKELIAHAEALKSRLNEPEALQKTKK